MKTSPRRKTKASASRTSRRSVVPNAPSAEPPDPHATFAELIDAIDDYRASRQATRLPFVLPRFATERDEAHAAARDKLNRVASRYRCAVAFAIATPFLRV
jgi:hypothetical protein